MILEQIQETLLKLIISVQRLLKELQQKQTSTAKKPGDILNVVKSGTAWRLIPKSQMGEKKLTRRYRMEFDDEKAARDYMDEQMKESTKLGQAAPEYKNEEGIQQVVC